jgi:hypothetical protein
MKARDISATRTNMARRSRRVWTVLGSWGVVVTLSSAALAQPVADAKPTADKAKPKAEAPKADAKVEAPKADAKVEATKPPSAEPKVLPGDLDEPADSGSWLESDRTKEAPQAAPDASPAAAVTPDAAAAPAPAANAPAAEPSKPAVPVDKSQARVHYALPEPTEAASEPPPTDYETLPLARHQDHWFVSGGYRASWIEDAAFDPFSEDDVLGQLSLNAGRTVYAQDRLSVAVSGMFDFGTTSAPARSLNAEYQALRLGLGLEGRYHLRSWLYAYARVTPGAVRSEASLDSTSGPHYEAVNWSAAVDGSLGAAIRVIGTRDGRKFSPRVWLFAEVGYGWVAGQDLSLEATGAGAPPRAEPVELGELDASGTTLRLGALVTF